jgi:hypothetical protein
VGSIASSFIPLSPNEEERSALDAHARPGLEKRDTVQRMSRERPAALGSIMSILEQRRDQMFPKLRPEEIDRLRRFGEIRRYATGDLLFVTGEPSPGMFVLIAGTVAVSARDGLGHVVPIVEEGPGEFLAEVGQLAGRPALVDARAKTNRP